MPELLAWMIVVGLAVTIAGIFMLAGQIERHTRRTLEFMLHTHELILSHLERGGEASLPPAVATAELMLERRRAARRANASAARDVPPDWERRVISDRRRHGALER